MLPTFLIIGASKSGTTSLWEYVRRHPEVYVSEIKEPGFFVQEIGWRWGQSWYEGLFAEAGDAKARGEASATYTMFPALAGVPERIASVIPDVGLIYIMRDPIERMRSMYRHRLEVGDEHQPIHRALLFDANYVNTTRYALQLDQYLRWFPRSQVLLLTTEQLRDDRAETMQRVFSFIGVDPAVTPDVSGEFNRGVEKRAMRSLGPLPKVVPRRLRANPRIRPHLLQLAHHRRVTRAIRSEEMQIGPDLRRRLLELVRPDVERLREWMDPGFDGWGLLETPARTPGS